MANEALAAVLPYLRVPESLDSLGAGVAAIQEGRQPDPGIEAAAASVEGEREEEDERSARGRRIRPWLRRMIGAVRLEML